MVNSRVLGGQNLYSSWLWGLMVYIVLFRVSFMILMLRLVHVREQEYRSRLRCDLGEEILIREGNDLTSNNYHFFGWHTVGCFQK